MTTFMNSYMILLVSTIIFVAINYKKQRKYTLREEGITE